MGKEVGREADCIFNLYAEYIMRNAGLEETQAGIKTAGRNINNHSALATGLEKVSFHSNLKERQCQRILKLPHICIHFTC